MRLSNWFPNMARYIYAFINICSICHVLKVSKSEIYHCRQLGNTTSKNLVQK